MDFDGSVNLNPKLPVFNFKANIKNARLKTLKLLKDSMMVDATFSTNFSGNNLNNIQGNLLIEKINDLILKDSAQKGIIITDHNYESIIGISTRLTLLKEGKLHHIKNKDELVEKGYLSR